MLFNYTILFIVVILTVAAQLLIKQGVTSLGEISFSVQGMVGLTFSIFKNLYILSGLIASCVTFVLWVWLVSKIQLNILYPVTVSAQLVFLAVSSWLLFKESLSLIQIVGIAGMLYGIFLLLYKS